MRKNASRPDAENPEWTEEDFRRARPALDMLPNEAIEAIRRYRGQRGHAPSRKKTRDFHCYLLQELFFIEQCSYGHSRHNSAVLNGNNPQ